MSVELKWFDEEKRNLVYEFSERWTWEECFAAIDKAVLILNSIDYAVYLIIDFRTTSHIPTATFDALNRIAKAEAPKHPNTRGLIVIGLNRNIMMVFNVFQKIFPQAASRYQIIKDEIELENIIKVARSTN